MVLLLVELVLDLPGCIMSPHFFQQKVLHHFARTSRVGIDCAPTLIDNVNFLNASPVNEVSNNEKGTATCLRNIKLHESLNEQTMAIHGVCIFSVHLASSDGYNIHRCGRAPR